MVREAAVLQKTAREAAARLRTEPAAAAKSGAASPSEIVSPAQISVSAENLSTESSSEAGDSSTDASQSTEEDSTSMKGIKAAGDLLISGGSFTIDSADDSIHSNSSVTIKDGVFEIASGDDAANADEDLTVVAGTMNISESYEGLEALHLEIQDGDITLTASDDGLNAAGGTDSSGIQGGKRRNVRGRKTRFLFIRRYYYDLRRNFYRNRGFRDGPDLQRCTAGGHIGQCRRTVCRYRGNSHRLLRQCYSGCDPGSVLYRGYPKQSGAYVRGKLYPYGGNRFRGSGG